MKNLFADTFIMQMRLSDALHCQPAHRVEGAVEKMVADMQSRLQWQLEREAQGCAHCPSRKFVRQDWHDPPLSSRVLGVAAVCAKRRHGFTNVICPDGKVVERNLELPTPLQVVPVEGEAQSEQTPAAFPTPRDKPYIRTDPDRPQTASDAW